MSKNGVEVVGKSEAEVEAKAIEQASAKIAKENADASAADNSHLCVTLSEASYAQILEVTDRATARGLDSSFEHWLEDAIKTGTTARLRTWTDRDGVTLLKRAASGNANAIAQLKAIIEKATPGTNPKL